ncbi:MAG TPA: DUF4249 domain-containing protein [Puia sp.]|nr:DUF4249 domain-containing protein [Puia sp.]
MNKNLIYIFIFLIISGLIGCVQRFIPPVNQSNPNYLVVDGSIVSGQDSTIINLSRTTNVNDSSQYVFNPESGALVSVVGINGDVYPLIEQSPGRYVVDQLNLNQNELYKLQITTASGSQYLSDSIAVLPTPPIDSVSWELQGDGVHIYVNTHDPQNKTRYYRWKTVQTWEYHSSYDALVQFTNGTVEPVDSNDQQFRCWLNVPSTNLLLGSSAKLAQDIIYQQPVAFIPLNSQQLSVEYSIVVTQYALSQQAYSFWQLLQQNTEQLGSLFDVQPSEQTGNLHNVANPREPVLGYVSISTPQQQRIFISYYQVLNTWAYPSQLADCPLKIVPLDSLNYYFTSGFVPVYADVDQSTGQLIGYYSAYDYCVRCVEGGGTTAKPPFWP